MVDIMTHFLQKTEERLKFKVSSYSSYILLLLRYSHLNMRIFK